MSLVGLAERNSCALENLQRGRSGEGKTSVGALDPAASLVHRRNVDLVHTQRFEPNARADDISNGVQGPHLVEMHIFHRHAMDLPFGFGNPLENAQRMLLHERRQIAVLNQLTDLPVRTAMDFIMVMVMSAAALVAMVMIMLVPMAVLMVPMPMVVVMVVVVGMLVVMITMGMGVGVLFLVAFLGSRNLAAVVRVIRLGQTRR